MKRSWGVIALVIGAVLLLYFGASYDIDDIPSSAYTRIGEHEVIGIGARSRARDSRRNTKSAGTAIGVIACLVGAGMVLLAPRGP